MLQAIWHENHPPRGATDEASRWTNSFCCCVSTPHEWHRALGQTHAEEARDAQANARAKIHARA